MRLIDADALIDAIEGTDWYHVSMQGNLVHGAISDGNALYKADDIFKALADAPTIDAVPVVRCKDCVFRSGLTGTAPFMYHYCHRGVGLSGDVKDDDFCSYGERKNGE